MAKQIRYKTKYPGVYYIEGRAIGSHEIEKIYYVRYQKKGKQVEEKVGRQYQDDMTPAKATVIRVKRIEGKELSNIERRRLKNNQPTKDSIIDKLNALKKDLAELVDQVQALN